MFRISPDQKYAHNRFLNHFWYRLFILLIASSLLADSSTWNASSSSNIEWGDAMNWTGAIPGSVGNTDLGAEFPALPPGAGLQVSLTQSLSPFTATLENISFHNSYYVGSSVPGSSLNAPAALSLTISTDVGQMPSLNVPINIPATSTLSLNSGVSSITYFYELLSLNNASLIQTGSGAFLMNGTLQNSQSSASTATMSIVGTNLIIQGSSGGISPVEQGVVLCENLGSGDATLSVSVGTLTMTQRASISVETQTGAASGSFTNTSASILSGDISISSGTQAATLLIESSSFDIITGGLSVTSSTGNSDLSLNRSTLDIIDGSLQCSSIQDSFVTIDGSNLVMVGGGIFNTGANALFTIDQNSSVDLGAGGIVNLSSESAILTITDSSLNSLVGGILNFCPPGLGNIATMTFSNANINMYGAGVISNQGNPTDVLLMSNSQVSMSSFGSVISSGLMTFSGGSFTNSGVTQAAGNITLENGALVNLLNLSRTDQNLYVLSGYLFCGPSGLIFVHDTYRQSPVSTLEMGITSDALHGFVLANDIQLNGDFAVSFYQPTIDPGTSILLMQSSQPIQGTFTNHQFVNPPIGLSPHLFQTDTEVFVVFDRSPAIYNPQTLNTIMFSELATQSKRQLTNLHDRLRILLECSPCLDLETSINHLLASREFIFPDETQEPIPSWSAYLGPTGSMAHISHLQGLPKARLYSAGLLGGFDYAWQRSIAGYGVGSSFSYTTYWDQVQDGGSHLTIDEVYGTLYTVISGANWYNLSINCSGGGGYDWVHTTRLAGASPNFMHADGTTQGYRFHALTGLEYIPLDLSSLGKHSGFKMLFPILYMQYATGAWNSYRESGAGAFNLFVERQSWSLLMAFLGWRGNYLCQISSDWQVRPELSIGWQYVCNDIKQTLQFTNFSSAFPQITTAIIPGSRNSFLQLGCDFRAEWKKNFFIEIDYNLTFTSSFLDNQFYLQFEKIF